MAPSRTNPHTHSQCAGEPPLILASTVFAILAVLVGAATYAPARFSSWMQEDGWAEWATVYFFLLAGMLWLVRGWRAHRAQSGQVANRIATFGFFSLGLFCFFVAGEELSWGQRLFAFQPPEIFLENNFQQEANLHNFLTHKELAGIPLDSRFLVALIALGFGVLLPMLASVLGRRLSFLVALGPRWIWAPAFVGVAVAELSYPFDLTGEAAEMGLAMLFAADALDRNACVLPERWRSTTRSWRAAAWVGAMVGLSVATVPATEYVVYGSQVELRDQTTEELKLLAGDLLRADARGDLRIEGKRRVHKRIFTAIRSGYVSFHTTSAFLGGMASPAESNGPARRDRKGYYLDPWNSPIWLIYDRDRRVLSIYSFGANRRRDTDFRQQRGTVVPVGDDIAVSVRLST